MVQKYRGATGLSGDWGVEDLQYNTILDRGAVVQSLRKQFTAAEVNAGAEILPAVAGYKYRIVDWVLIAVGGNAATADSVDINGTQSESGAKLFAVAVAALTRSTTVKPNSANVTPLTDGVSFSSVDANTSIDIGKSGSNLATATGVIAIVNYVLEAA